MKMGRLIILGALLGGISQAALALQETKGGSDDTAKAAPGVGLGAPAPTKGSDKEIRVPGLGTIGVLPKLDFGLELLYGATGQPGSPIEDKQDTGAQIRGTLKYRFPN